MIEKNDFIKRHFNNVFGNYDLTKQHDRITETIQLIPDSVKQILDAGSGNCYLSNLLKSLNKYEVTSVDVSIEGIKNAKSRGVIGAINNLPFHDKHFDLVICCEVLEHLPKDIYYDSLRELLRISNKYILITVPNNENLLQDQIKCHHCDYIFNRWGHVRSYSKSSFKWLLKDVSRIDIYGIGRNKTERSLNWLYLIGRKLGKQYDLPDNNVCINCGNIISECNNSNLLGYIVFRLIWRINKHFPHKKNDKTWIAFLLEK